MQDDSHRDHNHEDLGPQVDLTGNGGIGSSQFTVMLTDKRFVYEFSEIDMWSPKTTVEDACQGSLRPTTVRTGMTVTITEDKTKELG